MSCAAIASTVRACAGVKKRHSEEGAWEQESVEPAAASPTPRKVRRRNDALPLPTEPRPSGSDRHAPAALRPRARTPLVSFAALIKPGQFGRSLTVAAR